MTEKIGYSDWDGYIDITACRCQLFGSVPAADLLPESRMMAPSAWAATVLHSASGLGALTYPDVSTVVMPNLHGDGGGH
jgi:hypothetical protein